MINYSGLPQRVRRIVKTFEHYIDRIENTDKIRIYLKEGYQTIHGDTYFATGDDGVMAMVNLKGVIRPSGRSIKVALFGFTCGCGQYVRKGSNYVDQDGFRVCTTCGLS